MRENLHLRSSALRYDNFTSQSIQPWDELLISRILEEKRRRPAGGRLVDLGAGTGAALRCCRGRRSRAHRDGLLR